LEACQDELHVKTQKCSAAKAETQEALQILQALDIELGKIWLIFFHLAYPHICDFILQI
jgi:hypothetical protein